MSLYAALRDARAIDRIVFTRIQLGAKITCKILVNGQFWRFLTPMYLHAGVRIASPRRLAATPRTHPHAPRFCTCYSISTVSCASDCTSRIAGGGSSSHSFTSQAALVRRPSPLTAPSALMRTFFVIRTDLHTHTSPRRDDTDTDAQTPLSTTHTRTHTQTHATFAHTQV